MIYDSTLNAFENAWFKNILSVQRKSQTREKNRRARGNKIRLYNKMLRIN